jgi:serine/threonine protein kinase
MTSRLAEPFAVNGRYEIAETPLGKGELDATYGAYDNVNKTFVVLRTFSPVAASDGPGQGGREWTKFARLRHPNIVGILDTGNWLFEGRRQYYFVMPFLLGTTLKHLLAHARTTGMLSGMPPEPLPVERTFRILAQVCRGLQAAHDQGLVHGDIKPSNIFISEDETVKILGLGVAHLSSRRAARDGKGAVRKGTPTLLYTAPEQLDRQPATAASDIFSLGVVCYEALTGDRPFARESEAATLDAIRTQIPPPASEINPAVNRMLSQTVQRAMAKQPWQRFSQAREFAETFEKALRNEPIERFELSNSNPRIERVKQAHLEGDDEFALEILTELEAEGETEAEMPGLRIQIEQAIRRKNIRLLLENARVRMEEEEYPLALQKLAAILALDPAHHEAQAMQEQIERRLNEHRLRDCLRVVREQLQANLFSQARQGLQEALGLDSANTQARQMLAELEQTEHETVMLLEEKRRLYESAVAYRQNGDLAAALESLERALAMTRPYSSETSPDLDVQCQSLYTQIRDERDNMRRAYDEGLRYLLEHNIARALEICEEHLRAYPGDPMFQALKLEAEQAQSQEQSAPIAEIGRRLDAEPDLDKKDSILKEVVEKYPREPYFRSALKLIGDRRDLVNAIVTRARRHEERSEFEDAADQWDILRNIYPSFPGLDSEEERLKRRIEERARSRARERWIEDIKAHFNLGEYAQCGAVIGAALNEFPDDRELIQFRALAEQGAQRDAEVNALLEQGRHLCAAQNYRAGLDFLRKAARFDSRNRGARAALLSALLAHARELLATDWQAGEPLVKEALDLEPGDLVARSLQSVLDDRGRRHVVANILAAAGHQQAAGHLSDALQLVESGLIQYPNDHRLLQLLHSLSLPAEQGLTSSAGVDTASPEPAVSLDLVRPKLSSPSTIAVVALESATGKSAVSDAPSAGVAPQATAPLDRGEDTISPSMPSIRDKPRFKVPVWAVVAIVGGAAVLAVGIYSRKDNAKPSTTSARHFADARPRAVANPQPAGRGRVVVLEANVPGTSFSEDGKSLSLASELPPGNHLVEAFHEGYLPDVKSFTVATESRPLDVKFDLRPILPQLRLTSFIAKGTLVLDDKESLDLQSGTASKEDLALGAHNVKIYDRGRLAFAVSFQHEPDQKPMLITPLLTQPLPGAVVASLSGSAKIYATRGLYAAPIASPAPPPPLVAIPPLGLEIPGSATAPGRFLLQTGKGMPTPQLVDSSAVPTLAVHLEAPSETTYVTVSSNAADCIVSVDGGQGFKQPLSGKSQSFPLIAGSHPIRLACPGYQDAEQTADIHAGDAGPYKVDFVMTPLPAPLQAKPSTTPLLLKVLPETARISARLDSSSTPVVLPNNVPTQLASGSYHVTAEAPGYTTKTETVQVGGGTPLSLAWELTKNPIAPSPARFFQDGGSWQPVAESEAASAGGTGWWICPGSGYSSLRSSTGSFNVDFLRTRATRTNKITILADCADVDCIIYTLDDHNLTSNRIADGKSVTQEKQPHGMDDDPSFHLLFEMSPNAIVVKNRAGAVLSTIERHDPQGTLSIQNGIPLKIN